MIIILDVYLALQSKSCNSLNRIEVTIVKQLKRAGKSWYFVKSRLECIKIPFDFDNIGAAVTLANIEAGIFGNVLMLQFSQYGPLRLFGEVRGLTPGKIHKDQGITLQTQRQKKIEFIFHILSSPRSSWNSYSPKWRYFRKLCCQRIGKWWIF